MATTKTRSFLTKAKAAYANHQERHRPTGFGFALSDSIAYVDGAKWDQLTANASLFLRRPYLELLERARPANLWPRFAIIHRDRTPVAAVACQVVDVTAHDLVKDGSSSSGHSGAGVPAGLRQKLARAVAKVQQLALKNVCGRVLVCGNLLSWGPHGVAFADGEDPATLWPAVAEALYRIRRAERLEGRTDYVLVKDHAADQANGLEALERFSYRAFKTDPNMLLDLPPAWRTYDDYLASMNQKYRKGVRKLLKDVETAGCVVEPLTELAPHADRLHVLYQQVQSNAALRPVTLPAAFLPSLATLKDDFRCTVIRRESELLGFVTTLRDGDTAVGYYLGFDRAAGAEVPLYLRLLHAVVADAIALGCERLSLGRTALEPKSRLGARPKPMQIWIRHRVPALNLLVQSLLGLVPHEEAPERSPFKEA
jgi:hypothetical protein